MNLARTQCERSKNVVRTWQGRSMNLQSEIISFRPRSRYVLRFSQDVLRSSWSSSGVMPPLTQHIAPYCTGSLGQFFAQKHLVTQYTHFQARHPLTTPPPPPQKKKKTKKKQKTCSVTFQQTTAIGILNVVHVPDQ